MSINTFKLKVLIATIATIWAAQSAIAVEFAQGFSSSTTALQEAALNEDASMKNAPAPQVKSATQQANEWLARHGMSPGELKRTGPSGQEESIVIQIGSYVQKATASTVSTVRNVGTMAAILDAKAQIIRFLQTQASASITNVMPRNDAYGTEYDRQRADLEVQIEKLKNDYVLQLAEIDKEKSKQFSNVTYDDFVKEGVTACLAKYNVSIDFTKLEEKAAARLAELEQQAKTLDGQLAELTKLQAELKGKLNSEQNSQAELLSSMVLMGAVVVNSFESLIDNEYEVAVVISWSTPQERFIRSLIGYEGNPHPFKPTSKKTREEYINSLRWERVAGGRWIVTKDGVPRLYAVGTAELRNKQSHTKAAARALANTNAMSNLAMALQSDVASHQKARERVQNLQDGKGGEEVQVAKEIAQEVSAGVKNLQIQGASLVFDQLRTSPLTGRPTHVCVYEFSPLGKKLSRKLFDSQRDIAVEFGKDQQRIRGYNDESQKQIEEARQDPAAYQDGRSAAAAGMASGTNAGTSASLTDNRSGGTNSTLRNSSFGGEGDEDFTF